MLVDFLKLSANEPLADLLGAATDIVQLRISPEPATWVLIDVAIATMQLDTLVGDRHSRTGRCQVDGRAVRVRLETCVEHDCPLVGEGASRLHLGVHVGELGLQDRHAEQRRVELFAISAVQERFIHGSLCDSKCTSSQD